MITVMSLKSLAGLHRLGAIHLWRPHGGGEGDQAQVDACGRREGSSPMWTSKQKIKITVHWRHKWMVR